MRNERATRRPGRPPGKRPKVPHRKRPWHTSAHPLHITLRANPRLPCFRVWSLYRAFERAFRTTRWPDFRIVEYSVQSNHVHMIVEASNNAALTRGMRSFLVRANRLFNAAHGRGRGKVWADRYHARALETPRQVRRALVYCLANFKKHQPSKRASSQIDAFSSGPWFDAWSVPHVLRDGDDPERPTPRARTDLLRTAWRHLGLIRPTEAPHLPG